MVAQLVVSNSTAAVAWSAYDTAMLELQGMYLQPARSGDTPALRTERARKAEEVICLWSMWRDLFLGDQARPAA